MALNAKICGELAKLVARVEPNSVVEIGCGIGSLLRRIDAPVRVGYDIDSYAIKYARLIRSKHIRFVVGSAADVNCFDIDVLIAVDWLRDFPPNQIAGWIKPLLSMTKFLLVDRILLTRPQSAAFHHDFQFLNGVATLKYTMTFEDKHTSYMMFEVLR